MQLKTYEKYLKIEIKYNLKYEFRYLHKDINRYNFDVWVVISHCLLSFWLKRQTKI